MEKSFCHIRSTVWKYNIWYIYTTCMFFKILKVDIQNPENLLFTLCLFIMIHEKINLKIKRY